MMDIAIANLTILKITQSPRSGVPVPGIAVFQLKTKSNRF
jgi:hypothetical protein